MRIRRKLKGVSEMKAGRRLFAVVTAMAVAFCVLVSLCFVAAVPGHDCVGEGCLVCAFISVCENTLASVAAPPICAAALTVFFAAAVLRFAAVHARDTLSPVNLRVKLSD